MLVFGSGALAGLLSSLLAYIGRTAMASTYLPVQDLLRVGAIIAAVGSGAAFLAGLNMMALTVPQSSSTRPKTQPEKTKSSPNGSGTRLDSDATRATNKTVKLLGVTASSPCLWCGSQSCAPGRSWRVGEKVQLNDEGGGRVGVDETRSKPLVSVLHMRSV